MSRINDIRPRAVADLREGFILASVEGEVLDLQRQHPAEKIPRHVYVLSTVGTTLLRPSSVR